jgi:hypothetical protein
MRRMACASPDESDWRRREAKMLSQTTNPRGWEELSALAQRSTARESVLAEVSKSPVATVVPRRESTSSLLT